jgi:hypothetical protein
MICSQSRLFFTLLATVAVVPYAAAQEVKDDSAATILDTIAITGNWLEKPRPPHIDPRDQTETSGREADAWLVFEHCP